MPTPDNELPKCPDCGKNSDVDSEDSERLFCNQRRCRRGFIAIPASEWNNHISDEEIALAREEPEEE